MILEEHRAQARQAGAVWNMRYNRHIVQARKRGSTPFPFPFFRRTWEKLDTTRRFGNEFTPWQLRQVEMVGWWE